MACALVRGGAEFPLLHCSVGRPSPGMGPVNFVLTDFSPTEKQAVEEAIARVGEAVPFTLKEGLAAAMNRCSQRESHSN